MSTYKLYYFNGRGLAETSRLIFAAAGEKYEDIRIERDDWPKHKPNMPLGQMPVLEYNGTKLPQSRAIGRFLAKQFHLAGRDNLEQAKVDAVVDTINDTLGSLMSFWIETDEATKAELKKEFLEEELPHTLGSLETLAKQYGNGSSFFVGSQLTWADLLFYNFATMYLELDADVLENFPWLTKNRQEVEHQPKIAQYLKQRPVTAF